LEDPVARVQKNMRSDWRQSARQAIKTPFFTEHFCSLFLLYTV
jgi:hypothetical protein